MGSPPHSWQTFYVKPRKPVKGSVVIFQHVECQLSAGSNIISTHVEARTWCPVPVCIQNFGDTDLVIDWPLRVASLFYMDQWLPPSQMHFEFQNGPQVALVDVRSKDPFAYIQSTVTAEVVMNTPSDTWQAVVPLGGTVCA